MWTSALRSASPLIRNQIFPGYYCACLKSTAAEPSAVDVDGAKPIKDMPGPSGRYAIPKLGIAFFFKPFGNFTPFTFHELLDSLHDKYGRTFRMEMIGKTVVTADPDAFDTLYRHEGKYPSRPTSNLTETYFEKNNRTKGMAFVNGPEWHRLRSAAQKYLTKVDSAALYVTAQAPVADDLITRISTLEYTPEEFRQDMFKYATESIGVVCFNKRLGFLEPDNKPLTPETARYLKSIQQFFVLLGKDLGPPIYKIFPTKLYKDFEKTANYAYGYGEARIDELLKKVERQIEDGTFDPEAPNLILNLHASPNMTKESMNTVLLDILIGAADSTGKSMELFLRNLAMHPDKQEKMYEEILRVIGPKGNKMEAHHMNKMPYFRGCMKESFRLTPPTPGGTLMPVPCDLVIDGYLVPKGTNVLTSSRRVTRDSKYFENPNNFEPERWLRDEKTNKREKEMHAFSLLPFGVGVRNCVGRRFAEQELWLGVAKIIQHFQVSVSEADKNYDMIYTGFGQAKNPTSFTFTPRKR